MRRIAHPLTAFGFALLFTANLTWGQPARTVESNCREAEVIVIGRLETFDEDPAPPPTPPDQMVMRGNMGFIPDRRGGANSIAIQTRLKGDCPDSIVVRTGPLFFTGYGPLKGLSVGQRYLIFLSRTDGRWATVDQARPFVPISPGVQALGLIPATQTSDVSDGVIGLLIDSLSDAERRTFILYTLIGTQNPAVERAVRSFMDDPDPGVRRALACQATNQVVEVIPRIADMTRQGTAFVALYSLEKYKTRRAIPYLNPLIIDPQSEDLRRFATMAMRQNRLADETSIPYLIKALRMPAHQPYVYVYDYVYQALHELDPALGPWQSYGYFRDNQEAETRKLEDWWRKRQAAAAAATQPMP